MKTLGFVGTAKNTGKTTAALHLLELVNRVGIKTALTSIGYDGENTDHVTGLPKPRYYAHPGMTIATAENCLPLGTARYNLIKPSGMRTILGEIMIAEVSEPGYVVLAGPNRRKDLEHLLGIFNQLEIKLTIIDGALNRLAAMVVADGMVLSTGAAFDDQIDFLVEHAALMVELFNFPIFIGKKPQQADIVCCTNHRGEPVAKLHVGSVTDLASKNQVTTWLSSTECQNLFIPGVFYPELFKALVDHHTDCLRGKEIIFSSPLNILVTGSLKIWQGSFERLKSCGAQVSYTHNIDLYFLTVNPFYPKYIQKNGNYVTEFVDKYKLLQTARDKICGVPVIDILQPPHPDLLKQCGILYQPLEE